MMEKEETADCSGEVQMKPQVSVIVPVHNAQTTLKRCVNSIIHQEYTDLELLLIDDGSTDGSGVLCDEFAAQDKRVTVIHKENSGVSDARNLGLSRARGTYLQFVDSDDWITPDATKRLVKTAEDNECDLVIADFYRVIGERLSPKGNIDEAEAFSREKYAAYMMENPADFYYGVLWNKLFRREIVEKYQLRMDSSVSWCEDFMFNLEYIRHAKVFCAIQIPLYYYVKTKGSLVSQGMSFAKTVRMKRAVFDCYTNFYKNIFSEEDYEKIRFQVYRFLIDAAGDGTLSIGAKKLKNQLYISMEGIGTEGILPEIYRNRKLLDYYLEPIGIKYDLSLKDVRLLLCLCDTASPCSKRDLADRLEETSQGISRRLQRLAAKGYLKTEEALPGRKQGESRKTKRMRIDFLPEAEPILQEIRAAQSEDMELRLSGFTEEERELYRKLTKKMNYNMQKILSNYGSILSSEI